MQVYLDNNATTSLAPEVFEAMSRLFQGKSGNASSQHSFGREAKVALENARELAAEVLGAEPAEVIFCSGGTEADNLCLVGSARPLRSRKNKILTSAIEHPAIRQTAASLEDEGFECQELAVNAEGYVSSEELSRQLTKNTAVVSVMYANNEIGVVQDIASLAKQAHQSGALFHTDAVQAFGKIPVRPAELDVDLLSLSAHKIYGPQGVGLVYCRSGVKLAPLVYGGAHERGRRPGTENVAGAVGMATAMDLTRKSLGADYQRLSSLSESFLKRVRESIHNVTLNGPELQDGKITRTPSTVNLTFSGAEGEAVVLSLDLEGIAVSSGSACSSGAIDPSPVLLAIGCTAAEAKSSIRFSLGRHTTEEELDYVCATLPTVIERLRMLSPRSMSSRRA